ncbi:MAG: dTDP-4-dehydro-6-deoxyglucose aminotransferase [Acidobacteria bacterium]|nr:MAG: dTDP-4-dehydro-6-deoxyglucose aminotransferase [Acidobacteriota bacterium]
MKNQLEELAVLGGKPFFARPLHVGSPNLGDRRRLMTRIEDLLNRRWFTNNGPFVREFEQRVAYLVNVRNCVAMCNATKGLELVARALGLHGEVIIPSFTFVATAHALQWQQITPIFCDVDATSHNIDPDCVERMITPKTTGIIGVHVWGRPCNTERLAEIATRRGLTLLFDAAHAFSCTRGGRMIGGFGAAEVFSFHATKFFNTFEGGAVVTNDDALARKLRLMNNFGFSGYDNVIYLGTNGKMNEVCAAMGLTNLECLEDFVETNRRNYRAYRQNLAGVSGVTVIEYDETERCNYQYIVLEIDEKQAGVSRDTLMHLLHAENVLARRYFYPGCHGMEPYHSDFPHWELLLPNTRRLCSRVLSLPNGQAIGESQIQEICSLIKFVLGLSLREKGRLKEVVGAEEPEAVLV